MSTELCSSTPNTSSSEISPLDYLFEDIDLHRVTADCDTENIGSWKTLEKLGFWREAHFVESFSVHNGYTSEYHYGLLQREWRARTGQGNAC